MRRKEFIAKAGRISLFGILAIVVGILAGRRQLTADSCFENSSCGNCGKLKQCDLPEAKAFRKHE